MSAAKRRAGGKVAKLLVYKGESLEREVEVTEQGATIGRGEGSDILLPDPTKSLSRCHARLRFENGQWVVVDLNSQNGTWVQGKRIARAAIAPGGTFVLGSYRFVLVGWPAAKVSRPSETTSARTVSPPAGTSPASWPPHPPATSSEARPDAPTVYQQPGQTPAPPAAPVARPGSLPADDMEDRPTLIVPRRPKTEPAQPTPVTVADAGAGRAPATPPTTPPPPSRPPTATVASVQAPPSQVPQAEKPAAPPPRPPAPVPAAAPPKPPEPAKAVAPVPSPVKKAPKRRRRRVRPGFVALCLMLLAVGGGAYAVLYVPAISVHMPWNRPAAPPPEATSTPPAAPVKATPSRKAQPSPTARDAKAAERRARAGAPAPADRPAARAEAKATPATPPSAAAAEAAKAEAGAAPKGPAIGERYLHGKLALAKGDFPAAIAALQAVVEEKADYEDAASLLEAARSGARNGAKQEYEAGVLSEGSGDLQAALRHFEQALKLDPTLGNAQEGIRRVRERRKAEGEEAYKRAKQYDALGRVADAIAMYEKALLLLPPDDPLRATIKERLDALRRDRDKTDPLPAPPQGWRRS